MSDASSSSLLPHRGTLILVLGIVGLVVCMPVGIAAWVMGNGDLAAMQRGEMDPAGRDMTNAGRTCGIIAVALGAVSLVICLVILVTMVGVAHH